MDPITISALVSLFSGLLGAGSSFIGQSNTNKVNKQIAAENIAFQTAENNITRMREDNAYQRAAADLTAAGLSKFSLTSPASAAALSAPQNNYEYVSPLLKASQQMDFLNSFLQAYKTKAEVDNINAQTNQVSQNIAFNFDEHDLKLEKLRGEIDLNKSQSRYHDALARLREIEGENYAEYWDVKLADVIADVNVKWSEFANNNVYREEIKARVEKTIQETSGQKLKNRKLLYEMANDKLDYMSRLYNFSYSIGSGLRTTDSLPASGVIGSVLGVKLPQFANLINNLFGGNSGFNDRLFYNPELFVENNF